METSLLLTSQKNEVFIAIEQAGLDPSEFDWRVSKSTQTADLSVAKLVHRQTGYFFEFDLKDGRHFAIYSPGRDTRQTRVRPGAWQYQFDEVLEWVSCLKRETETPDLWAAVAQEKQLVEAASASDVDDSPFTPGEQDRIHAKLKEIQEYLFATKELTEGQADYARRRFEYLEGAVSRLGRRDWLHTTIGVLTTIIVGVALSSDEARELLRFVGSALGEFFGGHLALPQ